MCDKAFVKMITINDGSFVFKSPLSKRCVSMGFKCLCQADGCFPAGDVDQTWSGGSYGDYTELSNGLWKMRLNLVKKGLREMRPNPVRGDYRG